MKKFVVPDGWPQPVSGLEPGVFMVGDRVYLKTKRKGVIYDDAGETVHDTEFNGQPIKVVSE